MPETEHSNAEPAPGRADAASEARGETPKAKPETQDAEKPASPAETEANQKQTAQRAS